MFRIWLIMAYMGFFKYEGFYWRVPKFTPKARVCYPCGGFSQHMTIGNALDYARIFGGKVVK